MSQQLTFSLSFKEALEKEDFFLSECNLNASAVLGDWENWAYGIMVLVGPKYSGKTHLCSAWSKETNALRINVKEVYDNLDQCLRIDFVCIEDIDKVKNLEKKTKQQTEEALFHLINHFVQRGKKALFSAKEMPNQWRLSLKDLESRMLSFNKVSIKEPDDKLILALLLKLFNDRQVTLGHNELHHIASRIDRSFSGMYEFVQLLDKKSLALQRKINLSLIKETIKDLTREEYQKS